MRFLKDVTTLYFATKCAAMKLAKC